MLDRSAADAAAHAGDPDFMTSLARGLAVLMAFDDQQRAVTCAQLSHRTGLSRAAVRRCLHTLVLLGFASCEDGKHYRLTPKVLALGHAYLSSSPLVALAPGVLERLAARTGESASVATLEGREIAYVARSHGSDRIMSINLNVGSRLPAYCTSLGRVLLAALPPEKLDAYLAEAQPLRRTARTIATVTELRDAIRLAGEQGYAVNDQELEVGLRSIAVPVRDRRGRVVAAMNVGTLSSRRSIAEMEGRLLPVLREAAEELGRMLA
ncbi:IclR family transcriptional regulator domain-containing protein [Derxia gummosa]|uniref:IclR family transcriptional regulator domain-containing protein n=1 Tax=Derxia gummosa DSM 723 TaxID=1121388 RepID=A0A8B6X918_9BURK|nr:IclR family transcriptional regulator C-terminal domain-containing protein [Derxia gummosa]